MKLEDKMKKWPTIKADNCPRCGNPWWFRKDQEGMLECTTCNVELGIDPLTLQVDVEGRKFVFPKHDSKSQEMEQLAEKVRGDIAKAYALDPSGKVPEETLEKLGPGVTVMDEGGFRNPELVAKDLEIAALKAENERLKASYDSLFKQHNTKLAQLDDLAMDAFKDANDLKRQLTLEREENANLKSELASSKARIQDACRDYMKERGITAMLREALELLSHKVTSWDGDLSVMHKVDQALAREKEMRK